MIETEPASSVPPAPRSHHSGTTSEVQEVADLIQGMMAAQNDEDNPPASSWRSRCVRADGVRRAHVVRLLTSAVSMYRMAELSQEANRNIADSTASSPPLRSGTPPHSSYHMAPSSDSDAEPELEVAQLTASDTSPRTAPLQGFVGSRMPRADVGVLDAGSAGMSSSIHGRRAQRTTSSQPSSPISQHGFSREPMASTAGQPTHRDLSPKVMQAFGGEMSPPHSGTRVALRKQCAYTCPSCQTFSPGVSRLSCNGKC